VRRVCFIILCYLLISPSCQSQEHVERQALEELAKVLSSNSFDIGVVWSKQEFEIHFKEFSKGSFYINGSICDISTAYEPHFQNQIGFAQKNYSKMNKFRDSIKEKMRPRKFEISDQFSVISFENFKKNGLKNDYFFVVKNHLEGIESFVVEISVVPFGNYEYPFQYTFHVYVDPNGRLTDLFGAYYDPFEFSIDCD